MNVDVKLSNLNSFDGATSNPAHRLEHAPAPDVIPAHQDMEGFSGYVDLASREGYDLNRELHVASNGERLQLT